MPFHIWVPPGVKRKLIGVIISKPNQTENMSTKELINYSSKIAFHYHLGKCSSSNYTIDFSVRPKLGTNVRGEELCRPL